jgi:hypothetical protein
LSVWPYGDIPTDFFEDTMANRNYPSNRVFGFHMLPVRIDCSIAIGSTGAVSSFTGSGIAAVTRLTTGTYQIQLEDNYYSFLSFNGTMQSPVTGSNVAAGSLSPGTIYQITALGTSTQANWVTAGVPAGITAAVGVVFKCAATSSGNGTAKAIGVSGISGFEIIGNTALMISNQPFQARAGGFITFQTLGATSSSVTTAIPTDPASGSTIYFETWLNNSSVQ